MGIYLPNMEMPQKGQMLVIFPDGTSYVCFNGMRERLAQTTAVPVPEPHGRLIDESAIDLSKYEKAAHDALHNGRGSILYDSGVLAGARAIIQLVRRAPTIIPAEEKMK